MQFTVQDELCDFKTYEDYLDSHITERDLFFLEDLDVARRIVELNLRGLSEIMKRQEFEARKKEIESSRFEFQRGLSKLAHKLVDVNTMNPLQKALAEREEANLSGKLNQTIVFIRIINTKGHEISGYIDYANRLSTENMNPFFSGKRQLKPQPCDLSYYNWNSNVCTTNSSPNYQTIIEEETFSLIFINSKDRKVVFVDPKAEAGERTTRTCIKSPGYLQIVLLDHATKRN